MAKVRHVTMRGESYSGWGWSFSQSLHSYVPLVDYDKPSPKVHNSTTKSRVTTLPSPKVCPICHCVLPLSGKCDCQ